jgi:hypothetical protein
MHVSMDIAVWIGAGLTLCIYSFLYKDNPFYKFAEHLYVGVSMAYVLVIDYQKVILGDLVEPLKTAMRENAFGLAFFLILLGVLGLLMFTRFFKKYAWISRYPLAYVVGSTAGYYAPNQIQGYLLKQSQSTVLPLFDLGGFQYQGLASIPDFLLRHVHYGDMFIMVGVIGVLIYFFFSIEHKGFVKGLSYIGILYLMVFFGASFGYMMMGRISLLIGRMRFLLLDWLGLGG